jgi:hypothetical protein
MPTFVVFRVHGREWVAGRDTRAQPLWPEHAAFMDALFDERLIVLGGPYADGDGALVVMEAGDEAEIRSRLAADPWIVRDILPVGEIREWRIFLDARRR